MEQLLSMTEPFNAYCMGIVIGANFGVIACCIISIVIKGNKP